MLAVRLLTPTLLLLGFATAQAAKVPGVVIDYQPAAPKSYIGSPGLAVLPDGNYVASHDFFGPGSGNNRSVVFGSTDRGCSWHKLSELEAQWWSSLFVHRGALYILGTTKEYGNIVIRRSIDGGQTWSEPTLIRDNGGYHCAPTPVIVHNGRIWRGFERRDPPVGWGITFCAGMLSVPIDADLMQAASWQTSNFLPGDAKWLDGTFRGWLEGNAVVTRDGRLVDILRVDTPRCPEKAAIVDVSPDGRTVSFDPQKGFIDFPGGAKKFTIRFDEKSQLYWTLASTVPPEFAMRGGPGGLRNTLSLVTSPDLRAWTVRCHLLRHADTAVHGFQYVEWLFDGDDIIAACRTAYDDDKGGAHNFHDANYLTFHRVENFRAKTMADSAPLAELEVTAGDLAITGFNWTLARMAIGQKAFNNRTYVWQKVPELFRDGQFTRMAGGEKATLAIRALKATTAYVATTEGKTPVALPGWKRIDGSLLQYDDKGKTVLALFQRSLKAGEKLDIPQGNWAGTLVVVPPAVTPWAPSAALLKSEFFADEPPTPSCHAGTLVEGPRGLVAAWFGGLREGAPDVGIWLVRQENGRWTKPVEVANGVQSAELRHPCWNPVLFQPKDAAGKPTELWLFYKVGPSPQTWWGMLRKSTDGGQTWSKATRLPDGILGPIKNKPVQLSDGTILCPTSSESNEKPSKWQVYFEKSADLGGTWTKTDWFNDGLEISAIQPSVLFHPQGKLEAVGRTRQKQVFQIWSNDGGKTWGKMSLLADLPNPNSGTDAVTLADGRHLLVYNHTPKGRSPLNVALSRDGQHWQNLVTLESEPGEYSYPACIQTSDGLVHIAYTWKRLKMKHAVLDPAKLKLE